MISFFTVNFAPSFRVVSTLSMWKDRQAHAGKGMNHISEKQAGTNRTKLCLGLAEGHERNVKYESVSTTERSHSSALTSQTAQRASGPARPIRKE